MALAVKVSTLEPSAEPARRTAPFLSLVLPLYNEEEVFAYLQERLMAFLDSSDLDCEVILVNDGSCDRTQGLIEEFCRTDLRIKGLSLSRNFGHQIAVTAGLEHATGEVVVIMDGDLQDPPELIHQMLEQHRKGFDVVYAQREERLGESVFKRATAFLFYRMMRWLVHPNLPPDTGDFRLMSRAAVEALLQMPERHRFLRGMVAWVGFRQTAIRFSRPPRTAGQTKYGLTKMIGLAWNASISFSPLPLRINLAIGFFIGLFGALYGAYSVFRALVIRDTVPGWTTLVVLLCLIGGWILISIGTLGEYVARIFEEVKERPLYLVAKRVNFSHANALSHSHRRITVPQPVGGLD